MALPTTISTRPPPPPGGATTSPWRGHSTTSAARSRQLALPARLRGEREGTRRVSDGEGEVGSATADVAPPHPAPLRPCMDRGDNGRVFGDMVDASYRHLWPVGEGLGCRGRRSRSCRSGMSL